VPLPDEKGGGSPGELQDTLGCMWMCEQALVTGGRGVVAWELMGSDALGCLASLTV